MLAQTPEIFCLMVFYLVVKQNQLDQEISAALFRLILTRCLMVGFFIS